jgi:centrin-1
MEPPREPRNETVNVIEEEESDGVGQLRESTVTSPDRNSSVMRVSIVDSISTRRSSRAPGSRRPSVKVNKNGAGNIRLQKEDEETQEKSPHFDLTGKQLQEIREMFDLFDTDGSGSMDPDELRIVMRALGFNPTKAQVWELASEFADEDNESLCFEEFLFLMAAKLSEKDSHAEMMRGFRLFDVEGRGFIGFRDLKRVAKELGEHISDEDIQIMIDESDKDGDGEIGEEDWIRIFALK